jgi:DNA-binding LytR/AlgR family response regulator
MTTSFQNMVAARERNFAVSILIERPEEICYLESDEFQVTLILDDETRVTMKGLLNEMEPFLPSDRFFRCGWSHIINADKVIEFWMSSEPMLVLSCGNVIPVSVSESLRVKKILESLNRNSVLSTNQKNHKKESVNSKRC